MSWLECHDLARRFGDVDALAGVSLSCPEGGWTWIVGPSGSGKTTLLRAIAGLETLDRGAIHLQGRLASNARLALEPHQRDLAMLFQQPSLWPHLSARANVALGLPGSGAQRRAAAERWLARLGVAELATRFPAQLSGGEARRVEIARALAGRPRLLLLDEPAAHLDLHLRASLLRELRAIHDELRLTTLCVTHRLEAPLDPADRVVVIEAGRVAFDGPLAEELNAAPESPYIQALRRAVRHELHSEDPKGSGHD